MKNKKLIILFIGIWVVPFASAALFDGVSDGIKGFFSGVGGFFGRLNPLAWGGTGQIALVVVVVIAALAATAGTKAYFRSRARDRRYDRGGKGWLRRGAGWLWRNRNENYARARKYLAKGQDLSNYSGNNPYIRNEMLRLQGIEEYREKKRDVEDRIEDAEKQLDAFERDLMWKEQNLTTQVLQMEGGIQQLLVQLKKMVEQLSLLKDEFEKIWVFLQRGNVNEKVRERIANIQRRIINGYYRALPMVKSAERGIQLQGQKIVEEKKAGSQFADAAGRAETIAKKEGGVIEDIIVAMRNKKANEPDKKAKKAEGKAVKKGGAEADQQRKIINLDMERAKAAEKARRDMKREEKRELDRLWALRRIERYCNIALAKMNREIVGPELLRQNMEKINEQLRILFPKKEIIVEKGEHIQHLLKEVNATRTKKLKPMTRKKRLGKLVDKLNRKADKEAGRVAEQVAAAA